MTENGLVRVVNLSGGVIGRGAEERVELEARFPAMQHLLNVDWRLRAREGFGAYMARSLEVAVKRHGFKGLKISKALGLYLTDIDGKRIPVDWPELDPMWEMAGELGVPVAIHTSDPKAFWLPVTPENERFEELNAHPSWSFAGPEYPSRDALLAERDRMIAKHPKTTFMCVHFGNNPEDLDAVDTLLTTYPNVVIDTAARLGEIGRHSPEKVRAFFIKHQDRILFGTDMGLAEKFIMLGSTGEDEPTLDDVKPFYDAHWRFFEGGETQIDHPTPIQGRWKIDAINLPEAVLNKLYFANAKRIFKLDDPGSGNVRPQEPPDDGALNKKAAHP